MSTDPNHKLFIDYVINIITNQEEDGIDINDLAKKIQVGLNNFNLKSFGVSGTSGTSKIPKTPKTSKTGEPTAHKHLSGYNIFNKIVSIVYKDNNKKCNFSFVNELWKTANKDLFNNLANKKEVFKDTDIKSLEEYQELYDSIDVSIDPPTELSANYNGFLSIKRGMKERNIPYNSTLKWSQMSDSEKLTFFDTHKQYASSK